MSFKDFVEGPQGIITVINNAIIPLIFTASALAFIWGVANYFVLNGGDESKIEHGREFALWGLLGMVLLFSVWGLVHILLAILPA